MGQARSGATAWQTQYPVALLMNALTRCHANCSRGRLLGAAWSPANGVDPVNGADDRGCRSRPHRGRLQVHCNVESALISICACGSAVPLSAASAPPANTEQWRDLRVESLHLQSGSGLRAANLPLHIQMSSADDADCQAARALSPNLFCCKRNYRQGNADHLADGGTEGRCDHLIASFGGRHRTRNRRQLLQLCNLTLPCRARIQRDLEIPPIHAAGGTALACRVPLGAAAGLSQRPRPRTRQKMSIEMDCESRSTLSADAPHREMHRHVQHRREKRRSINNFFAAKKLLRPGTRTRRWLSARASARCRCWCAP